MKTLVMISLLVVVVTIVTITQQSEPVTSKYDFAMDTRLTPFSEQAEETTIRRLTGQRGGLINFWASWCEPCFREMPSLIALKQYLARQNIPLIFVSVDDNRFAFEEYLLKYQFEGQFYRYTGQETFDVVPTTILVSDAGEILKIWYGERDWQADHMKSEVLALLGTPPPIEKG